MEAHSMEPSYIQWIIVDNIARTHAWVMVCGKADLTALSAWQQGRAAEKTIYLCI